jgi:hypothetical protein
MAKKETGPTLVVERVKLDRGGYVAKGQAYAGRYFGAGAKLWRVTDDDGTLDQFVRADSKAEAKAKVLRAAVESLARSTPPISEGKNR